MALACFCVQYDINAGVMIRNSNAFACQNMVLVGKKKFDRRSSVGTHNYENMVHLEDSEALVKWVGLNNYSLVCVDYVDGVSVAISDVKQYPTNPLFLMGSERNGIPPALLDACEMVIHINQFGCVRSLNVGVASGIILNDWHNKHGQIYYYW